MLARSTVSQSGTAGAHRKLSPSALPREDRYRMDETVQRVR
ncbi:hypothetical protein DSM25558_3246 [Agrobacterium sp. DSM 25558]|nr:hypothetical protein [Agrobacterium sp. DSM 25558]SCX22894.1 hypothetical protein DSM25558_3246 [Agrobacterium sp. DSM 25558]